MSGTGALCVVAQRSVSGPGALCVGPRCSLRRAPVALCIGPRRSLCRAPALFLSGPARHHVQLRNVYGLQVCCMAIDFSEIKTLDIFLLKFVLLHSSAVCVGLRHNVSGHGVMRRAPALCVGAQHSLSGPALAGDASLSYQTCTALQWRLNIRTKAVPYLY